MATDKNNVTTVTQLPEIGESDTLYICDSKIYFWNGNEFASPVGDGVVSETVVDTKIQEATDANKIYVDEQIANAFSIVEF